jgi:hypothetical protein
LQPLVQQIDLVLTEDGEGALAVCSAVARAEGRDEILKERLALKLEPGGDKVRAAQPKISAPVERIRQAVFERCKFKIAERIKLREARVNLLPVVVAPTR